MITGPPFSDAEIPDILPPAAPAMIGALSVHVPADTNWMATGNPPGLTVVVIAFPHEGPTWIVPLPLEAAMAALIFAPQSAPGNASAIYIGPIVGAARVPENVPDVAETGSVALSSVVVVTSVEDAGIVVLLNVPLGALTGPVNAAPERAAAPRLVSAPAAVVAPVPPQGMPVGLPQEDGSALFELFPENGP